MPRFKVLVAASYVMALAIAGPVMAQGTARDLPRAAVAGTASLAGIVLTDDHDARPLRRVRVFLNNPDIELARTTISDDGGRFVFAALPKGRYTLGATKEGYVTVNYGAKRTGRPGTPVTLAEGQALADVVLRLPRGAVITGVLLDAAGQPLGGVSMRALRYVYTAGGERRLSAVNIGMASHVTDDRGVYRIYGLAAGEYAIAAPARLPVSTGGDVHLMTEADVRRGLEEIRPSGRQQTTSTDAATASAADPDGPRTIGYAPVFFPGTTVASQAAMVSVAPGEERADIDFQLQLVPTSTIRGTVVGQEAMFSQFMKVMLIENSQIIMPGVGNDGRTTTVSPSGAFSFSAVPPGQYTVLARSTRGIGGAVLWAASDVVIEGQGQTDIMLSLQPGFTVSGRVAFEGTAPRPDLARVRATLTALLSGGQVSLGTTPTQVDSSGRFTITGITPARYRLQASISGAGSASGWVLKSSVVNNRDSLDVPLDLRQSLDGAVITFTDRAAEISGVVRDGSGQPLSGDPVILFAAERTFWTPMSRRVRMSPATEDGVFAFRNVPPGDYLIAALPDVEDGEWYDPTFLERLSRTALRIAVAEGEKKTQDVRR